VVVAEGIFVIVAPAGLDKPGDMAFGLATEGSVAEAAKTVEAGATATGAMGF
jgi:hypothetical protein